VSVRRVILVGASAGGLEALVALMRGLPGDLPAAVLVAVHMAPRPESSLPTILARSANLEVVQARDGERLRPGRVYVAAPDHHLVVREATVGLWRGPPENGHRPAVDPLFRSGARTFGPRAVGVVLSGNLEDGTAGLRAIAYAGGVTVVQAPEDARYPGMPSSGIANVAVDHIVLASEMGPLLSAIVRTPEASCPGPPSLVCPDCGCRAIGEKLEEALWAAVRSLREHADLARRLAAHTRLRGMDKAAQSYEDAADSDDELAAVIRELLAR
jgi:two-component system chemotaxis response regulator CheB